jgi:hypothetical protein
VKLLAFLCIKMYDRLIRVFSSDDFLDIDTMSQLLNRERDPTTAEDKIMDDFDNLDESSIQGHLITEDILDALDQIFTSSTTMETFGTTSQDPVEYSKKVVEYFKQLELMPEFAEMHLASKALYVLRNTEIPFLTGSVIGFLDERFSLTPQAIKEVR